MRRLVVAVLGGVLTACSGSSDPIADGCLAKIRYEGTAYVLNAGSSEGRHAREP